MERIELFNGILCFTPLWGIVDVLLIVHFLWSWRSCRKRTGWKVDVWYWTLFLGAFQSILVMYPFNASIYNAMSTLGYYARILPFIDIAFCISVVGYLSIWVGRYLFDRTRGTFPLMLFCALFKPCCQMVENNIKSQKGYIFVGLGTLILGSLILGIQFSRGYIFNGRDLFLMHPFLRPLFNVTISLFPLALSFFALRYIQFQEKRCLRFLLLLLSFTLFFGIRSLGLGALVFLFSYSVFYRRGQLKFYQLFAMCFALALLAVLLGDIREGHFDLIHSFSVILFKYFYGNNFSDTRDFAWILSFWDEEHLYGKTYLAALISFIPRFLSSFREEWSISMYTNGLTGFNSETMPGLRPGLFGEAFLNFSYPGVILYGILFGFFLRFADVNMKRYVETHRDIIAGYSSLMVFTFLSCLSVSGSMWLFYVFLLANMGLVFVRGRVKKGDARG